MSLGKIKKMNWTFIGVQIVILIFYIGVTWNKVNRIEKRQDTTEIDMKTKADKTDITEIKSDLREIRNYLLSGKDK